MHLLLIAWVKKIFHGVETDWLSSKENILGAAINKEGHIDYLLGYEKTNHFWFPWKSCNCKQCFLLPISEANFPLFIEWPLYILLSNVLVEITDNFCSNVILF